MIFSIVLLLGQASPELVTHRHFVLSQAEWVYQNSSDKDMSKAMPPGSIKKIHDLGNPKYKTRQEASMKFGSSDADIRDLVWGSHHRDAEIAFRSNALLDKIIPCTHCKGTKNCPGDYEVKKYIRCIPCKQVYDETNDYFVNDLYNHTPSLCLHCFNTGLERHHYTPEPAKPRM